MLTDIKQLTELYLQNEYEALLNNRSWNDFHNELILNASLENIKVLTDAPPKKCKYALFVNVNTEDKTCEINDYVEFNSLENWPDNLLWRGSGGAKSEAIRSNPHKVCSKKENNFSTIFIKPLETILEKYCILYENDKKKVKEIRVGPLFWDEERIDERIWLQNIVDILKLNEKKVNEGINEKYPTLKPGEEEIFVGLTIDNKSIGEYELFRRYLLFVRFRSGIQDSTKLFGNKKIANAVKDNVFFGLCPSCKSEKLLLDQWTVPAELSFYQKTDKCHFSYEHESFASFRLCQACADSLYIFKQRLLPPLTRELGGNECLVLPSVKSIPEDFLEKIQLYASIKSLVESSKKEAPSSERRLIYRLGKLGSCATVTFAFGDAIITKGDSTNVRRLDKINIIFPDVLPSRLSKIDDAIKESNCQLSEMWDLTGRNWNCQWKVTDDFVILKQIYYPYWEEKKKEKSKSRKEVETYLRAIFYGYNISYDKIADDCTNNLISSIKKTIHSKQDDTNSKATFRNYMNSLLSLFIFLDVLKIKDVNSNYEVLTMNEKITFEFQEMPNLGKFIEMHPFLKEKEYLSPFFVGCLFSYAEYLQKNNSRVAAYNWLGTMSFNYTDILEDIYPKVLNYISSKEKIVSSPRIQEIMKAVAYFDVGKCDNDRAALISFCHGWALGRDFIFMKKSEDLDKSINEKRRNNDE
ncbi:TM1802 family CRISPR-associated protein [Methanosarcina sp.]|uniref:TM1802 family CRISPR-associated protein n=1 Tax=Methanosarcina sp. TaxID=2213 RepID=UPI002AB877EB|nr:TM1802 family CRISPR-associated protein [Methanosarcina sp.]MDY9925985.1 TM1802 family CRISPR-associated protein [Methanosarcina sp.]